MSCAVALTAQDIKHTRVKKDFLNITKSDVVHSNFFQEIFAFSHRPRPLAGEYALWTGSIPYPNFPMCAGYRPTYVRARSCVHDHSGQTVRPLTNRAADRCHAFPRRLNQPDCLRLRSIRSTRGPPRPWIVWRLANNRTQTDVHPSFAHRPRVRRFLLRSFRAICRGPAFRRRPLPRVRNGP